VVVGHVGRRGHVGGRGRGQRPSQPRVTAGHTGGALLLIGRRRRRIKAKPRNGRRPRLPVDDRPAEFVTTAGIVDRSAAAAYSKALDGRTDDVGDLGVAVVGGTKASAAILDRSAADLWRRRDF